MNRYKCSACAGTGLFKIMTQRGYEDVLCMHGVLDPVGEITDTDRLEFMIETNDTLFRTEEGFWWKSEWLKDDNKVNCYKTYREAIDAAMKENKVP